MVFKIITAKDGRKVVLRSIVASDVKRAKEFVDCLNSVISEGTYILFTDKLSVDAEKEWIKGAIARVRNNHFTFIAECEGKIIGTATLAQDIGTIKHVATAGLMIQKGYREMGIGSEMMKILIETAKHIKVKLVKLNVFGTNKRAQSLYKKFGFKEVARISKLNNFKGKFVDDIIMIRKM